MNHWTDKPADAWRTHILPSASSPTWLEDSTNISTDLLLSKRELFGLIILAHLRSSQGAQWLVGYEPSDPEPNDGYIADGKTKMTVEHKLTAQQEKSEPLSTILSRYSKNADKGAAYGANRTLLIQANQQTHGMIRMSALTDLIKNDGASPFDRVLTLGCVSMKNNGTLAIMHVIQHHPPRDPKSKRTAIAQVDFDLPSGEATVPLVDFNFDEHPTGDK